ncbi:MAG: Flp/Fap pilin component [Moraxellaceae bacterium]|jgi:pilus assembly protein Flp/PilA|nr:Flp/Fap pilin component [Moraxellaceae bacterium]
MKSLMLSTKKFIQREEGVTAIEYALIAALIAVTIVTILGVVGTDLNAVFSAISEALKGAVPASE